MSIPCCHVLSNKNTSSKVWSPAIEDDFATIKSHIKAIKYLKLHRSNTFRFDIVKAVEICL